MTTPLTFTLTNAGRAALVDRAAGGTNAVVIAEAGITAAAIVVTPTLTALPGEIKRVATIAGIAPDADTIHLTVRDDGADAYTARGLGFYLADGTLFAVYGQPDPFLEKSVDSIFLVAADIKVADGEAELIEFGAANFLNPPASETVKGVAYLATIAEALAGAVVDKIITPATMAAVLDNYVAADRLGIANGVATLGPDGKLLLAQRPPVDLIDVFGVADQAAMLALAATVGDFAVRADNGRVYVLQQAPATILANWLEISTPAPVSSVNGKVGTVVLNAGDVGAPPVARSIGVSGGLLTGGGSFEANRTIELLAASAAEVMAGAIANKAVTPAALATLLATLAGKASGTRTVTGAGLVTGGGALADNPVLEVLAASAAEILAGAIANKAVTPAALAALPKSLTPNGYFCFPGGLILQWVQYRAPISGEPAIFVPYPTTFPSQCFGGVATVYLSAPSAGRDLWAQTVSEGLGSCLVQLQGKSDDRRAEGFNLWLLGC